jgi:integrase
MLAERAVRSAKATDKDLFLADGKGLYLRVSKTGTKTFLHKDQRGGKTTWTTLGHYPAMGLADAREALAKRKSGRHTTTVKAAFNAYYRHLQTQFRDPEQTERMFRKDLLPEYGEHQISELTRANITALLQGVVDRGSPVMANRMLTQFKRFLDYCEDKGWIDSNPLEKVKRRNIGGKEVARGRNLSWDEIETLVKSLFTPLFTPGTAWVLYGCLLTGCRASEVLDMSTFGVILDTKSGRAHKVPLSIHVRHWLRCRPAELPKDHRVLSHALRRLHQTFTPHDLRRTYATRLADLEVAPHVIEKLLNHQMVGVMAVYNRADYWPERLAAQKLWCRKLRELRKKEAPGA